MCEMCNGSRRGDHANWCTSLVRDRELMHNKDRDFFMQMIKCANHSRIENGRMIYDPSHEEPLYCLKAVHCEHDVEPNRGHSISIEIKYCPFCGRKF